MRRLPEFDPEPTSPFSVGSLFLRLWPLLEPNLPRLEGPLAAESKADLQSSPDDGPPFLGLSVIFKEKYNVRYE